MAEFGNLLPAENGGKTLSNWDKPGGATAKIFMGLLIGGGLLLLYKILPWLITLATNILTLILLCVAIAAILWLLTDKNIRRMVSVGYFMLMRKLTGLLIEIDPIAIVERRIRDMKLKIQEISKIMGNLKGLIIKNQTTIATKKKELEENVLRVKEYESRGEKGKSQVANNQVKRLKEMVESYIAYNEQSEKWYEILKKLEEMANLTVLDTENEVSFRKEQFKLVKEQHKAFKSVINILKGGDLDEMQMFVDAMDYMANDISMKLGEMEDVINSAGGLLDEYDIDKGIASKQAIEIVKRYDEYGIDGMFESFSKKKEITQGNTKFLNKLNPADIQEVDYIEVKPKSDETTKSRYF
ncbi:hypothetical protein FACS189437_06410 [Bacteroidia bacterium]|nr:hypothetical protein FACS189437_06410 [Bacteroidia bacterium]